MVFTTLGLGHDEDAWRAVFDALALAGYDYVVSIEHEDPLLETEAAITAAIRFLRTVLPTHPANAMVTVGHSDGRGLPVPTRQVSAPSATRLAALENVARRQRGPNQADKEVHPKEEE